jgi:hypothetical protein
LSGRLGVAVFDSLGTQDCVTRIVESYILQTRRAQRLTWKASVAEIQRRLPVDLVAAGK